MVCPLKKAQESLWSKIKRRFELFFSSRNGFGSISKIAVANLQAILDTTVDSIITIDEDCIVKAFNKTAEKMFGYTKKEIVGQNVNVLMPEPFHSEHDHYVLNYLRTGQRKIIGIGREVVAKRKDGTTFPIDLAVSEVIVDDHRLFTGIIRDISGKKEAEMIKIENLRIEAEIKTKNEFITMISHELRTPLHAIMGFTECLINEIDGPLTEKQEASLQHIYNASQHLLQLVNGVLDLSKISSRQVAVEANKCNLLEILDSCLQIIKPLADQKSIQLKMNVPTSEIIIKANPEHLHQVLLNLLSNAVKFTDKGSITISLFSDSKYATLSIEDTGIGIDSQDLSRLFTPFTRFAVEKNKRGEDLRPGFGIGLTITKKLIELYEGTIEVASEKGKGSIFTIRLKIFDEEG